MLVSNLCSRDEDVCGHLFSFFFLSLFLPLILSFFLRSFALSRDRNVSYHLHHHPTPSQDPYLMKWLKFVLERMYKRNANKDGAGCNSVCHTSLPLLLLSVTSLGVGGGGFIIVLQFEFSINLFAAQRSEEL
jgi:hypothetical protein